MYYDDLHSWVEFFYIHCYSFVLIHLDWSHRMIIRAFGIIIFNNVSLKQYLFRGIFRSNTASIFRFFGKILAGGRCPPDPPNFGWGGFAPPDPPLDGFSRGAAAPRTPRVFFFSPLTTRAPPGRPAGRPPSRPPGRRPRP